MFFITARFTNFCEMYMLHNNDKYYMYNMTGCICTTWHYSLFLCKCCKKIWDISIMIFFNLNFTFIRYMMLFHSNNTLRATLFIFCIYWELYVSYVVSLNHSLGFKIFIIYKHNKYNDGWCMKSYIHSPYFWFLL